MLSAYILITPLYILSILGLAWRSWVSWRVHHHLFYLMLYLFLLGAALIGGYALVILPPAAIIGLLIIVAIYTGLLQPRSVHTLHLNPWLWRYTILGSLVVVILSGTALTGLYYRQVRAERLTQTAIDALSATTNQLQTALSSDAPTLSSDAVNLLTSNLSSGQETAGLENFLPTHKLDFATLLDVNGTVLARSLSGSSNGDNLFQEYSWLGSSDHQIKTTGFVTMENGLPAVIILLPLENKEHQVGFLYAGKYLSSSNLGNLSLSNTEGWAFLSSAGVISHTGPSDISTLLTSTSFDQEATHYLSERQTFEHELTYQNKNYAISGTTLATLDHSSLQFLNVRHE